MVDPLGGVATIERIDHPAIVQMEIKGVVGVGHIVRVAGNCLGHGDDLAHILDDRFTCRDVARREHAFAVQG